MSGYTSLVRPILFRADPERAHERTLRIIARLGELPPLVRALTALAGRHHSPVTVAGVRFPGRVGLAAGMDKDGRAVKAWSALGFGHVELGTVTARAQPGNERPRLFRLPASGAIINRMGFNNAGAQALADRLAAAGVRRGNGAVGVPVGVSIGKTKLTPVEAATADYLQSLRLLAPYADYVAINVSSPNTPGLRALQDRAALDELVRALLAEARQLSPDPVPILVKLAPDLSHQALDDLLEVCTAAGISGLIATNTTLRRDGLDERDAALAEQTGGLSGAPLTRLTREVVSYIAGRTSLPVIGVGGVMNTADGTALVDAGATLLQLYTGFVYRGPRLIGELNRTLKGTHDHPVR